MQKKKKKNDLNTKRRNNMTKDLKYNLWLKLYFVKIEQKNERIVPL